MAQNKEKNERELLKEINEKLDKLITIFGIQSQLGKDTLKKLSKAGFNLQEMQNITGIDKGDISREIRGIKRDRNKKNGKGE